MNKKCICFGLVGIGLSIMGNWIICVSLSENKEDYVCVFGSRERIITEVNLFSFVIEKVLIN